MSAASVRDGKTRTEDANKGPMNVSGGVLMMGAAHFLGEAPVIAVGDTVGVLGVAQSSLNSCISNIELPVSGLKVSNHVRQRVD